MMAKMVRKEYTMEISNTNEPHNNEGGTETTDNMMLMQITALSSRLPQDITSDILSRLHVKSVMRCRCVCKAWQALINSSHFTDLHLTRSSQHQHQNLSLLLISLDFKDATSNISDDQGHPIVVDIIMDFKVHLIEHMLDMGKIDQQLLPLEVASYSNAVTCSCNGLLCLASIFSIDKAVLICNPFIRKTIELPRFNISYDTNKSSRVLGWPLHGTIKRISELGYHPTTKEYKVISIAYIKTCKDSWVGTTEVYTLGSSSWRSKGNIPFEIFSRPFSVLVNGALHWLTCSPIGCPIESQIVVITSFDIGDEEFRVLPVSLQLCVVDTWQYKHVQELRGLLSLVDISSDDRIDIWLMKDYSVEASWVKQFVVHIPELVTSVSLLWQLEDGQVLLFYNKSTFISYDPNNDQITRLAVPVPDSPMRSFVHVGSLVSPRMAG